MGFKIVAIGRDDEGEETRETVHEIEDRRVTKVHVLTRSGEACAIGIDPDQTEIALTFEYANPAAIHLDDVDRFKYGYGENQTGEDVDALAEELSEIRPNANVGGEVFTQEAADAAAEAEEAAAEAAQAEPVTT